MSSIDLYFRNFEFQAINSEQFLEYIDANLLRKYPGRQAGIVGTDEVVVERMGDSDQSHLRVPRGRFIGRFSCGRRFLGRV